MPDFPFDKLPQTNLTHTISREFPNQYLVKMIPGRISDEICIYKSGPNADCSEPNWSSPT